MPFIIYMENTSLLVDTYWERTWAREDSSLSFAKMDMQMAPFHRFRMKGNRFTRLRLVVRIRTRSDEIWNMRVVPV